MSDLSSIVGYLLASPDWLNGSPGAVVRLVISRAAMVSVGGRAIRVNDDGQCPSRLSKIDLFRQHQRDVRHAKSLGA